MSLPPTPSQSPAPTATTAAAVATTAPAAPASPAAPAAAAAAAPAVAPAPAVVPPRIPLFPAWLKTPRANLVAGVVPTAALLLLNACSFSAISGWHSGTRTQQFVALLFTTALPGLLALGVAVRLAKSARRETTFAEQFVVGAAAVLHLFVFFGFFKNSLMPGFHEFDLVSCAQFALMAPAIFLGILRFVGVPLKLSEGRDFSLSLSTTFCPILVYLPAVLGMGIFSRSRELGDLWVVLFLVSLVFAYVGMLRTALLLWGRLRRKMETAPKTRFPVAAAVALGLPLGGLLLNREVPFPDDFQTPWFYALTLLNGVVLLIPPLSRFPAANSFLRLLRWTLFPFTLYFFLLFLPFVPFATLGVLFLGVGLLVLAPPFLFVLHIRALRRDAAQARAEAVSRGAKHPRLRARLSAAVAFAVLPLVFAAPVEFDRFTLRQMLEYHEGRNYAADLVSPVSPWRAEYVLRRVDEHAWERDTALISVRENRTNGLSTGWYHWRVCDSQFPRGEKFQHLWKFFVDADNYGPRWVNSRVNDNPWNPLERLNPPNRWGAESRWSEDNQSVPSSSRWDAPDGGAQLDDIRVETVRSGAESESHATLFLSSPDAAQREYNTRITVPAGVWVSGLQLKIGNEWVDGKIYERRIAASVYRQITSVRRDPAFLRYADDGSLKLSVFPVGCAPHGKREVRISFLQPTGLASTVNIGVREVDISGGAPQRAMVAHANGVFATNMPARDFGVVEGEVETCAIVNCASGWGLKEIADVTRKQVCEVFKRVWKISDGGGV